MNDRLEPCPDGPCEATPAATLEQHIMDCNIPKSEAEWWAAGEIERLRAALANHRTPQAAPEGLAAELPVGAVENGREFMRRIEQDYRFDDGYGHLLSGCYEWQELQRCFETMAEALTSLQPNGEREAKLEGLLREAPGIVLELVGAFRFVNNGPDVLPEDTFPILARARDWALSIDTTLAEKEAG